MVREGSSPDAGPACGPHRFHRGLRPWLAFACLLLTHALSGQTPSYQMLPVRYPLTLGPSVYDAARDRIVCFSQGIWEYDGTRWQHRGSGGPSAVEKIDYDPVRRRTVCLAIAPAGLQTWEWDGDTWTPCQILPPSCAAYYSVYYPPRGRILLTAYASPSTRQLLEWDGTNWIVSTIPVPPRIGPMVYDRARQRIVTYCWPTLTSSETWEYDGVAWVLAAATNAPVQMYGGLVYDAARQRTLLFGGRGTANQAFSSELWEWDGVQWTLRATPVAPPARSEFVGMVFDEARQRTVVLGGTSDVGITWFPLLDMWAWDGQVWSQLHGQLHPRPYSSGAMCYDATRQRLLFVTDAPESAVWRFAGQRWQRLVATAPHTYGVVYDFARDRVVSRDYAATWEFDGINSWTQCQPAVQPPNRTGFGLAYDVARARTVMFGGSDGQLMLGDTWEWDGVNWRNAMPTQSPSPRDGPAMVYHWVMQGILLHGGRDSNGWPVDDTLFWNGATWSVLPTVQRPTFRLWPQLVYDLPQNRTFLFGGMSQWYPQRIVLDDVWELVGPNWVQVVPSGVMTGFAMAFDVSTRRTVTFLPDGTTKTFAQQLEAQTSLVGAGCPGSRGTPKLASDDPFLGNTTFALELLDTLPQAPAVVAWSMAQTTMPLGSGCSWFLGNPVVPVFTLSGPMGATALRFPIPDVRALSGLTLYAQGAVLDPGSAFAGVAVTAARQIVLGN